MIRRGKSSFQRHLGVQAARDSAEPEHDSNTGPVHQHQQRQHPAEAARPPTAPPSRGSKAQALNAFRSLVQGAALSRPSTAAAGPDPQPQQDGQAQEQPAAPPKGLNRLASAQAHVAQAANGARRASAAPTADARIPADQLIAAAHKALEKLLSQLTSRTLTYLYQFDSLLSSASSCLTALTAFLATAQPGADAAGQGASLQQLLQDDQHASQQDPAAQTAAVLDMLLQLCMQAWEAQVLLLQHHHAAEPGNTAQQAGHFHEHARALWEAWESHSTASAAAGGSDSDWPLTEGLCAALAVMAEAASAWESVQQASHADWLYQQLCKHLCSVAAAGANEQLCLDTRRALQRLQFTILTGNLALAGRQGHQAMWSNLTSLVQQLLQHTVLQDEEVLSTSLAMAGALADTATSLLQANSSAGSAGTGGSAEAPSSPPAQPHGAAGAAAAATKADAATAALLLEFTAGLLDQTKQRAAALCSASNQQHEQQHPEPGDSGTLLVQQVAEVQQQVLMQLAQAYLACGQPSRVLNCISLLQGLSTGRTPPTGLLQLSSLALLQQGKLGAASAQLCAWLSQGAHSTEEACAAVKSFLVALHTPNAMPAAANAAAVQTAAGVGATAASQPMDAHRATSGSNSSSCAAQERAAAMQQVAAAAAEHCGSNPAVGLEVVVQLLSDQSSGCSNGLERLAVKVLANAEVSQLLHQRQEVRSKVHTLLHTKGAAHYAAHCYAPAIEVLTPAVFFASSLTAGKSARLLAMSFLKSGQPGRALEYVGLAEQQEGCVSAAGCLIRLQAALQLQAQALQACKAAGRSKAEAAAADAAAADAASADAAVTAAVRDVAAACDVNSEALQAAFSMCMQHRNTAAAWQVLQALRHAAATDPAATAATTAAAAAAPGTAGSNSPAGARERKQPLPKQLRLLQVLVLMKHLAGTQAGLNLLTVPPADVSEAQAAAAATAAGASATFKQQLSQQQLSDMCCTLHECWAASPGIAGDSSSPATQSTSGPACNTSSSSINNIHVFTNQQVMWLVETGLQLGVAAAHRGMLIDAHTALQTALEACKSILEAQQGAQAPAAAAAAARAAQPHSHDATRPALSAGTAAAVAGRAVAAACAAASILLQASTKPSTAQHAQVQQAGSLLETTQQLLQQHALWLQHLLLQQLQGQGDVDKTAAAAVSTAEAAEGVVKPPLSPTAWATASAVAPRLQQLQVLAMKLSFTAAQRLGKEQQMKQLLQLLVQHPLTQPCDLKAVALESLRPGGPAKSRALAALAYSHMLRLAAAAAADPAAAAEAAVGMLTLVASHAVKIKAVSKLVEVLTAAAPATAAAAGTAATATAPAAAAAAAATTGTAAPAGSTAGPPLHSASANSSFHVRWILATCWNAAVETSRSGDAETGRQYLQLVSALAAAQQQQQQGTVAVVGGREQQPQHWLLGSKQFKQLWSQLFQQERKEESQPTSQPRSQTPLEACPETLSQQMQGYQQQQSLRKQDLQQQQESQQQQQQSQQEQSQPVQQHSQSLQGSQLQQSQHSSQMPQSQPQSQLVEQQQQQSQPLSPSLQASQRHSQPLQPSQESLQGSQLQQSQPMPQSQPQSQLQLPDATPQRLQIPQTPSTQRTLSQHSLNPMSGTASVPAGCEEDCGPVTSLQQEQQQQACNCVVPASQDPLQQSALSDKGRQDGAADSQHTATSSAAHCSEDGVAALPAAADDIERSSSQRNTASAGGSPVARQHSQQQHSQHRCSTPNSQQQKQEGIAGSQQHNTLDSKSQQGNVPDTQQQHDQATAAHDHTGVAANAQHGCCSNASPAVCDAAETAGKSAAPAEAVGATPAAAAGSQQQCVPNSQQQWTQQEEALVEDAQGTQGTQPAEAHVMGSAQQTDGGHEADGPAVLSAQAAAGGGGGARLIGSQQSSPCSSTPQGWQPGSQQQHSGAEEDQQQQQQHTTPCSQRLQLWLDSQVAS